jgi:hypothetical protein
MTKIHIAHIKAAIFIAGALQVAGKLLMVASAVH